MPSIETDIAVVGAGTAGVTAFHEIRRAGRNAVLIDHGPLGTTCARVGCMPSKAVLHAAHEWALRRGAGPAASGVAAEAQGLWRRAIATRDVLAAAAAGRIRAAAGEHLLMGNARFVGPSELDVDGHRVHARAFVVATGSRPVVPEALRGLGDRLLTTDTLFALEQLPRSIGIIGLGAVGLELGLALARLGVEVVAGDAQSVPAGIADPEVAARAKLRFARELPMWFGRPVQAQRCGADVVVGNGEDSASVDVVLAALGRRPNVEPLDLPQAGLRLGAGGQPAIDPQTLRAEDSTLFFAGDVQPQRPLMHEGVDEGVIAARGALRLIGAAADSPPARRTPLSIVFSDPDVVSVGTPYDLLDLRATVVGSAEGTGNGRSRILGADDNLVRIYAGRDTGRILGGTVFATRGEHLGHLLAWAVQRGETVHGLLEMPYYHPTIEEMLQSALKDAARRLPSH